MEKSLGCCVDRAPSTLVFPGIPTLVPDWLLLRQAMECPEPPDQIESGKSQHTTIRKKLGERLYRRDIGGVLKLRHNDYTVGDVEVRIAGGQPLAVAEFWLRKRQRHNLQRPVV